MLEFTGSQEDIISYVYQQFSLAYEAPNLSIDELKRICLLDSEVKVKLEKFSDWKPSVTFLYKEYNVPVFFEENTSNGSLLIDGVIQFDVFLNSFLLLSGIQEWMFDDQDKHGRFLYNNSLQAKYNFVDVPVVNVYFELIQAALQQKGYECNYKSDRDQIVFTHDIDQIRSGWFDDIVFAISKFNWKSPGIITKSIITKIFGLQDSYYSGLLRMIILNKKFKLTGISFLMAKKSHQDADYHLKKLKQLGVFDGQTIGLHPGYGTHVNKKEFVAQFALLKSLFPDFKSFVRQHFLQYNVKTTPKIHEEQGVEEDYSLGFSEQFGFRNSYAGPFQLYCFERNEAYQVIEIPLFFMDSTLINYIKDDSWETKLKVVSAVQKLLLNFNCTFSVLFHNSVFTYNKFNGFEAMYEKLAELSSTKKP